MVQAAAQLRAQPGGGAAWLLGLRDVPYNEAAKALCTLPGIGPKVTHGQARYCCIQQGRNKFVV